MATDSEDVSTGGLKPFRKTIWGKLTFALLGVTLFHLFGLSIFTLEQLSMFDFIGWFWEAELMASSPDPGRRAYANAFMEHGVLLYFSWLAQLVSLGFIVLMFIGTRVNPVFEEKIPYEIIRPAFIMFFVNTFFAITPGASLILTAGRDIFYIPWFQMFCTTCISWLVLFSFLMFIFDPERIQKNYASRFGVK